jgi:hypothetical protein
MQAGKKRTGDAKDVLLSNLPTRHDLCCNHAMEE